MSRLQTLNEMSHLEHSRFGRPSPRHGLKLLYWFAKDCLLFDHNSEMLSRCDPEDEEFGFHLFENRYERSGVKLLPEVDLDLTYYVVGNLNKSRSSELPRYVREEYTGFHDNSNMDRIIVSMDNEWIDKVYVTEHIDRLNYNSGATYRISKGLLKIIGGLSLTDFLQRTGFWRKPDLQFPVEINRSLNTYIPQPKPTRPVNEINTAFMQVVCTPRDQDTCIEIQPESDALNDSLNNSENDFASISMNRPKRKKCCQCTIL